MDMDKYRWIMYLHTPMPGDTSVTLRRVVSLDMAVVELLKFEKNSGFGDSCTATLYRYSEEEWEDAEEFATSGYPFDYPSKVIERGPRGGIKIVDA